MLQGRAELRHPSWWSAAPACSYGAGRDSRQFGFCGCPSSHRPGSSSVLVQVQCRGCICSLGPRRALTPTSRA